MPGTVRGILLQVTRFLFYLLRVETTDVVSLELFEDVGVEFADGRKIAEQDKSIRSANPLADRSNPDYSWRPRLGPWQAVPEPDSVTDNGE